IDLGELDGRESDRATAIAEVSRRAGIMGELSHNIMLLRWDKLVWNGAFNTVATLTRRRVGALRDDLQRPAPGMHPDARNYRCCAGGKLSDWVRAYRPLSGALAEESARAQNLNPAGPRAG